MKAVSKLCRAGIWALLILAILSLMGGFLGALHPLGDSLAVFRVPFAGLAMICAFILRRDARAALLGACTAIGRPSSGRSTMPTKLLGWLAFLLACQQKQLSG